MSDSPAPIVTETQRAALRRLADYLDGVPQELFDMSDYCKDEDGSFVSLYRRSCGTVACAVGYGPAAGISPVGDESWDEYGERVFGSDWRLWKGLFCWTWSEFDNTPEGAADRIRWFLDTGELCAPDGATLTTAITQRTAP